jgi:protein-arginine kinase/nucleoside diphosphate kinase
MSGILADGNTYVVEESEEAATADLDFDLVMDKDLAANVYPAAKLEAARAADHTALCAQFCTPEIWEKYKDMSSTGPAKWSIARAINSGVMYPSSFVGCHAGDMESYDDFKDFFYPVIQAYHKGFDIETTKHVTDMDPSKITHTLLDAAQSKIISTRIRVARNLSMFPLNPGAGPDSRGKICDMMEKVYAAIDSENDLSGDMFRHTTMSDEQRQGLIDDHFLFRGKDKMQAASGYHRYWPEGRGVFHNKAKTFVNWLNEGDHLRIISMEQGGDVLGVFTRLAEGAKMIKAGVEAETGAEEAFMMHPIFGSLTCCPSNIGTGMRGSVHILVPKLIKTIGFDAIDKMCRERNCQARGSSGEHSAVVDRIDVSNWRRIGFPEYSLVDDMIQCANFLAQEEDKVPDGVLAEEAASTPAPAPAPAPVSSEPPAEAGPVELTLALIRPDAVLAGEASAALQMMERQGFTVVAQKIQTVTRPDAQELCGDDFDAVDLLVSGPSVQVVLAKDGAINTWNRLKGSAYGSESAEAAEKDVALFFPNIRPAKLVSDDEAKVMLQEQVAPLLSQALVALAKAKPQNPLQWLAEKLKEDNPRKPPVTTQTGFDAVKAQAAREIFTIIDDDHNGKIDKAEFANALRQLGHELAREQSDFVFSQIDRDGDDEIDQAEFVEAFFYSISL